MAADEAPPRSLTAPGPDDAALVFSVQHFCLHDGPGVRSIVFFKGCPLRCAWCQNPESWRCERELGHKVHLCIQCRTCVAVCPRGAIRSPGDWDAERCDLCLQCVENCPAGAMVAFGEARSVGSLLDELRPEYALYRRSGGGVTLSGGEATLLPRHAGRLAEALQQDGVHVALETCGLFQLSAGSPVRELLRHTDLVLFDIKLFSDELHHQFCGGGNARIQENLRQLAAAARAGASPPVWPRLPVIPSITDRPENLAAWASFLREIGLRQVTLVPYHALGDGKRGWLRGLPEAPKLQGLSEESLARTRRSLADAGIETCEPGSEDWGAAAAPTTAVREHPAAGVGRGTFPAP